MTIELSVVIATHNRQQKLERCLEALRVQDGDPSHFEVIVACDGSSDGSAELAAAVAMPFPLRVLDLPKGGKATALNAGIEAAAGSVCLFLDDDVVAAPGLLAAHLASHREDPEALGIGHLRQPPPAGRNWFGRAHAVAWNRRYEELAAKRADWTDCYGGNFSAPRQALLEVGGFSVELPAIEDIELGYRLVGQGCRPRYLAAADAVHEDHKSRDRLLDDVERYGEFCARFAAEKPAARPKLLGWFGEPTPRDVALRRLLLGAGVPSRLLAALGGAIPGAGRKQVWFGFVDRYAFWRGARTGMDRERWRATARGVPVLMYHAYSEREEGDRFVISKRSFARQLRLLALLRYRVVGFEQLAAALHEGRPLPSRSVVLTIDDGYVDNLDIARPLLRRRGFGATVFLVSRRLGGVNDWTAEGAVAMRPLLTPEQVEQLRGEGIEIGAHTRNHPSLPTLDPAGLEDEIAGSREDLETMLGAPVKTFAYPYGQFDEATVEAARAAGFEAAGTVENRLVRLGDDPLQIPRLEIRGEDRLGRFLRKLWFGGA
jgi:peptidoglycan/xylan/chitin deacetylase (PgdA/CDA1 family)/GT2 family glycosyltransferase